MVTGVGQKDLLVKWLNLHDRKLSSRQKRLFENIKENLQYNSITIERRKNGENLIIIPLNLSVKALLGENADYLKLDYKTIFNLMIVQNGNGRLRWSSVIAYVPKANVAVKELSKETIQHILNGEAVDQDGIYKFLNLKGKLLYQIHYDKGRMVAVGKPTRQDALNKKKSANYLAKGKASQGQCYAWYEVTTWYYPDGHTETTEEYLFTTCDEENGGGGGGGTGGDAGDPEDENDQEIFVSGEDVTYDYSDNGGNMYQPVMSDNPAEQETDGDGNVIALVATPYPLSYRHPWVYSYRIIGIFKVNYAKAADTYADPTTATYLSLLGQVTRNVTCFAHNNSQDPVSATSVDMIWRCIINRRLTYHQSGSTEVNQFPHYYRKVINL
jgi:hypothetical protein